MRLPNADRSLYRDGCGRLGRLGAGHRRLRSPRRPSPAASTPRSSCGSESAPALSALGGAFVAIADDGSAPLLEPGGTRPRRSARR